MPEEVDQAVCIDYKWLWVYGFVEPITGKSHLYLMPYLNRSHFQSTIDEFVKEAMISKESPVLLVLDNTSCHRSKKNSIARRFGILFFAAIQNRFTTNRTTLA